MMKEGAKLVFVLMASLLTSFSVFAQTLQASVNKTQVAKNEVIQPKDHGRYRAWLRCDRL